MTPPALVGVDWGTSRLRVLLMGEEGQVLEQRRDPRGAAGLSPADFAAVLQAVAGDWLASGLPALVCGMAGARRGWVEAPYVACPVDIAALAAGVVEAPGARTVRIVPGVCVSVGDLGDVMRGEETQTFGLLTDSRDITVVAPGTHSKWIAVRNGSIASVRTFVTGELFAAVTGATIVGQGLGVAGRDDAAFDAGVTHSLTDPAITASLFSVRVGRLSDRLGPDAAADYLSGLLIGAEIAAAINPDADPVRLVGDAPLTDRYERALSLAGHPAESATEGELATARGLWRIWEYLQ